MIEMLNIIKCILALFLELNIYQCLGYAINRFPFIPEARTFFQKSIYGFLAYHVLFWCIAFPCTLLNRTLNLVTILWVIFQGLLLLIICIRYFKGLVEMYRNVAVAAWKNRCFLFPFLILVGMIVYYICVNGQVDIDARTYIGEITSMVDTGRLTGISVTSGQEMQILSLKRSFSMFGANSAVLCNLFHVHPLVLCRTTRAAINLLFFAASGFELFRWGFWHRKHTTEHAILCTMLALGLLFAFTNTIYTEARFLLYRAYEGKAYCASTLILITVLISIKLCQSMDKRYFILFFLNMLAGMSISASATFILPLAGGSLILAHALYRRKWLHIPILLLSVLPNLIYILLSISGFAGFHLEG